MRILLILISVLLGTIQSVNGVKAANSLPRWGGVKELSLEDYKNLLEGGVIEEAQQSIGNQNIEIENGWVKSVMFAPIIFIVFSGLNLILAILYCLKKCICLCCCCGNKFNGEKKPSIMCLSGTYIIVVGIATNITAFCIVAYVANVDFSNSLLFTEKTEDNNGNLFDTTVDVIDSVSGKLTEINTEVGELIPLVKELADDVRATIDDTSILVDGMSEITSGLKDISDNADLSSFTTQTVTYPDGSEETLTFPCTLCTSLTNDITQITEELDDNTAPLFDDLQGSIDSISDSLTDGEEFVVDSITELTDTISMISGEIDLIADTVEEQKPTAQEYETYRKIFYSVIFIVPMISTLFILYGGIKKNSRAFCISFCNLWGSTCMMALLLIIHYPLIIIFTDVCGFLTKYDSNVDNLVPKHLEGGNITKVIESCFDDSKLVEAFGLDKQINFTDLLDFPEFPDVSEIFSNFDKFDAFKNTLDSQDSDAIFDGPGDTALQQMNQAISECVSIKDLPTYTQPDTTCELNGKSPTFVVTRDNIDTFNPDEWYEKTQGLGRDEEIPNHTILVQSKAILETIETTKAQFDAQIASIKADFADIETKKDDTEARISALVAKVNNAEDLVQPLLNQTDVIMDTITCGVLADAYHDIKDVMCEDVEPALSSIVLSMIVIWITAIFGCCGSKILQNYCGKYMQYDEYDESVNNGFNINMESKQKQIVTGSHSEEKLEIMDAEEGSPSQPINAQTINFPNNV